MGVNCENANVPHVSSEVEVDDDIDEDIEIDHCNLFAKARLQNFV